MELVIFNKESDSPFYALYHNGKFLRKLYYVSYGTYLINKRMDRDFNMVDILHYEENDYVYWRDEKLNVDFITKLT